MPRPSQRTRSKKRTCKALPGGDKKLHFKQRLGALPRCVSCGRLLSGIPHTTTSKLRKLNRTKRRIWRPFGGNLCHNCLKNSLKQAVRAV